MEIGRRPTAADLELLTQTVRHVARSHHLSPADALDFEQTVHLSLLQRDYSVFTQFTGRSSLRTYLIVVLTRMLIDWRNSTHGKWRPSAAAVRLGADAVALERLIARDGHTVEEAIQVRADRSSSTLSELRDLVRRLPARPPRRFVGEELLVDVSGVQFDDPVAAREEQLDALRVRSALKRALSRLSSEDQQLIWMRWVRARSVRAIGEALSLEPKALYRRFDRVLRTLRAELVASGVQSSRT